jgi:hypothetical protein
MKARAALVIRSLLESGRDPRYIAHHVVDAVLREL